jgi:hypothetical protein
MMTVRVFMVQNSAAACCFTGCNWHFGIWYTSSLGGSGGHCERIGAIIIRWWKWLGDNGTIFVSNLQYEGKIEKRNVKTEDSILC